MAIEHDSRLSTPLNEISAHPAEAHAVVAENLDSPERPRLRLKKTIAIPGPSNVGKDVLVAELIRRHGWRVFDGTEMGFKRRKNEDQKYIQRKEDAHRIFDGKQARRFEKLTPDDEHELHQTRLSGIILAEQKDKWSKKLGHATRHNEWLRQSLRPELPLPIEIPAVSILLWARKEVRVDRAFDQALKKWLIQQEKLAAGEVIDKSKILKRPVKKDIEAEINNKDRKDILDWAPHHPKYIRTGEDPFNRNLKRPNGGPVYDYFLDNSDLTVEETADAFEKILLTYGLAEIIDNSVTQDNSGVGLDTEIRPGEFVNFGRRKGDFLEDVHGEPIPPRTL